MDAAKEKSIYTSPCCVIIAAGLSSRMGKFKPLLPVNGQPAIRYLLEHMQSAGVSSFVIVTGHNSRQLRKACSDLPSIIWGYNPAYARTGMFESAKIGFSLVPSGCDRVLFTLGDIPLISPEVIRQVLSVPGPLVFPSYQMHRGHPASIDPHLLEPICQYQGNDGLRGAFRSLGITPSYFNTQDPSVLMDMDTPEDYRNILKQSESCRQKSNI